MSMATQPSIPTLRKDRDTGNSLSKLPVPEFEVKGRSPELSAN
jgi:hypothetical protein